MAAYNDNTIISMKFLQHLREKSGMYAFQINSIQGLIQQLKEIVDNSVDEALDKNKLYPIDITFFVAKDKSTYQCLIQDRGRGIPVNKLADCFTKEFTSGKYRGEYGGQSSGTFGVGSKASAALAKLFLAFTKRDDGFGYLKIEKGVIKDSIAKKSRIDKNSETIGTTVFLQPDDTLFSKIPEMFKTKVHGEEYTGFELYLSKLEYYGLFKRNAVITVRVVDGLLKQTDLAQDPVELWKYFTNLENFNGEVKYKSDPNLTPRAFIINKFHLKEPIWQLGELVKDSENEDDPLSYNIDVFVDERTRGGNGGFLGAVNATPIVHPESSHIEVLQDVLKDQIVENINDADAKAFFEAKYRVPISGCISVGWLGAEFIGQDKTRFENRQFADCYRNNLRKTFKKLTEVNGEVIWDNLWDLIKENFDAEYAKFSKRSLGLGKSSKNLMYDLQRPDSYDNCISQNNEITELFITEGDSAAGRVQTVRDENTQAMFILSGKPQNAIRIKDRSKLEKNAIFSDLSRILNVGPADKDLSNMRFKKILIMTDADADGYHIVALLIGIFYKINPLILEEGRVAVTCPPLYAIKFQKKTKYLRDENALRDVKVTWYRTLFDIDISVDFGKTAKNLNKGHDFHETTLADGTKVHRLNKNHDQFRNVCMIVDHIGTVVSHEADLLNIDPGLLEQLLHCVDYLDEHNVNCKKIKETLVGCDDVIWDKENNVLILVDIQGVELRVPLSHLQSVLRGQILPLYEKMHWKDISLFITTKYTDKYVGEPCTPMMLYQIFKDISDICKITRFKGLGEMSADDIYETCVNKTSRCFITVRGIGDVDELYQMLDVDTEARKKLVTNSYLE